MHLKTALDFDSLWSLQMSRLIIDTMRDFMAHWCNICFTSTYFAGNVELIFPRLTHIHSPPKRKNKTVTQLYK